MPRVVAATGGFRGAATASEAALAVARGATVAGWACEQVPLSDGGEGFAEVFGGRARLSVVGGPLGLPLEVEWRLSGDGRTAAVESSLASGLDLVGGPEGNDAVRAGSGGTGQLVAAAVRAGARRVLVGVGPSASTDGGLGALEALEPHSRMHGVELVVGCDAMVGFVDSARLLAPDKGASPSEVALLSRRLERLVQLYRERFGVDVSVIGGAGAGGGLAGGLAALGASLAPGFEVVAEELDLAGTLEGADLVVTSEGVLDGEPLGVGGSSGAGVLGAVAAGVAGLGAELGVPVLVVAGDAAGPWADPEQRARALDERPSVDVEVLSERFGRARAVADPCGCVEEVVAGWIRRL